MTTVNEAIDARFDSSAYIDKIGEYLLKSRSFRLGISNINKGQATVNIDDLHWIVDSAFSKRDKLMDLTIESKINQAMPLALSNVAGIDLLFKRYIQTSTIIFTEHSRHLVQLGIQERTTTSALMRKEGDQYIQSLIGTDKGELIIQAIEARVNENRPIITPFVISVFAGILGAYIFKAISEIA